jgi:hypothetical protein
MSPVIREPIDEWSAIDVLQRLIDVYSKLGPVWYSKAETDDDTNFEEIENSYSLTVKELEFELGKIFKITPDPFHNKINKLIRDLHIAYPGYSKTSKFVSRDSEFGQRIFEIIGEICEYLRNAWERLHAMEEIILKTFPPMHFDFRSQISELNKEYFHHSIYDCLKKAISLFDNDDYEGSIDSCVKATERLTQDILKYLNETLEHTWKSNLDKIQKKYRTDDISQIDLHWFIYYLLCVVYFIRNPHTTSALNIPNWMDNYQKQEHNNPKWARITLTCTLEAIITFQKLLEHQAS